ncbi:amidohydrolase family protein [Pseudooceanicola pacificus]|nr:amidohydrolase family protein [Pseudooceanicola pacificus]
MKTTTNSTFQNMSRRGFVKSASVAGLLTSVMPFGAASLARAQTPGNTGAPGIRTVIRGGTILSMDPAVGDFERADILIEGSKILEIAPQIEAGDAIVVEAQGKIVIPGFIDTHHHLYETALRATLPDAILRDDGQPENSLNYINFVLAQVGPKYTAEDVMINDLFGSLSQLDAGVTTVQDISQIHFTPDHTDAAFEAFARSGQRVSVGYFSGTPEGARRAAKAYGSSGEGLRNLTMGGDMYLPDFRENWALARELGLRIAAHVVGSDSTRDRMKAFADEGVFGPDAVLIHMTGMTDAIWDAVHNSGARVSLSVPIEMTMRHGMPPIQKMLDLGMKPSLSTDVETTMTADLFSQMRGAMTLQRAFANEAVIEGRKTPEEVRLLTARDVLEFATIVGATALGMDHKTGSLTPGKEADIVLLDAEAINTAPLNNAAGSVVALMDRSNVDTVFVAGKLRKWQGQLLDADVPKLREELVASRDRLFAAAQVEMDMFR